MSRRRRTPAQIEAKRLRRWARSTLQENQAEHRRTKTERLAAQAKRRRQQREQEKCESCSGRGKAFLKPKRLRGTGLRAPQLEGEIDEFRQFVCPYCQGTGIAPNVRAAS